MTFDRKGIAAVASVLGIGIVLGLTLGWNLWKPKPPAVERYAREETLTDGSKVFEKKPQADAKPSHEIPKGAVVERIIKVEFLPKEDTLHANGESQGTLRPVPLPFTLDMSLVRMEDGTTRVVSHSNDVVITGGTDIPTVNVAEHTKHVWAAGAVYGATAWGDKAVGVFLDRDFAFVRTGVELTKNTYATPARVGWEFRGKIGITF